MTTSDDLTAVARRHRALKARRDALIIERRSEGATLRQIATEAGLSHSGVKRVIERGSATEPRSQP